MVSSSLYSSYYELHSAKAPASLTPRIYLRPNAFMAKMAGLSEEELSEVFHHVTQDTTLLGTVSYQAFVGEFTTHANKEQRARCDRAEMLHGICHISDDDACAALTNGHFTWTNLTPADIRLNRKLRGPCIQCLEGKSRRKAMPPSDTPPATSVGMCIVIDTQSLSVKSAGGNLHYIDSIDEFSGDVQVTPAKSLKSVDIFTSLMFLVHTS